MEKKLTFVRKKLFMEIESLRQGVRRKNVSSDIEVKCCVYFSSFQAILYILGKCHFLPGGAAFGNF